jgi:hypothetical protein
VQQAGALCPVEEGAHLVQVPDVARDHLDRSAGWPKLWSERLAIARHTSTARRQDHVRSAALEQQRSRAQPETTKTAGDCVQPSRQHSNAAHWLSARTQSCGKRRACAQRMLILRLSHG